MQKSPDGLAVVGDGRDQLGARVGTDVKPDAMGNIRPPGGISGFDGTVEDMPRFLVPPDWPSRAGTASRGTHIYSYNLGPGVPPETLVITPDPRRPQHLQLEPAQMTTIDNYQAALAATRNDWTPL